MQEVEAACKAAVRDARERMAGVSALPRALPRPLLTVRACRCTPYDLVTAAEEARALAEQERAALQARVRTLEREQDQAHAQVRACTPCMPPGLLQCSRAVAGTRARQLADSSTVMRAREGEIEELRTTLRQFELRHYEQVRRHRFARHRAVVTPE